MISTWKIEKGSSRIATILSDGCLVTGGSANVLEIWDVSNGLKLKSYNEPHNDFIRSASRISSFNDLFVTSSSDMTLKLWRWQSNEIELLGTQELNDWGLCTAKYDEYQVVTGTKDGFLNLWSISTDDWQFKNEFKVNVGSAAINIAVMDTKIAVGTKNGATMIWEPKSETLSELGEGFGAIRALTWISLDRLVFGDANHVLRIVNVLNRALEAEISDPKAIGEVSSLEKVDENRILTGGFFGAIFLWDINKKELLKVYEGVHEGIIRQVKLLDNQRFLTAGSDGKIVIWEL